jgi:hypothetical protein
MSSGLPPQWMSAIQSDGEVVARVSAEAKHLVGFLERGGPARFIPDCRDATV